jgi:uncharacterized protein YaeQ
VFFCINAQESLEFTKGLSAVDEPDIWARSLDDQLLLWIDVGEPSSAYVATELGECEVSWVPLQG